MGAKAQSQENFFNRKRIVCHLSCHSGSPVLALWPPCPGTVVRLSFFLLWHLSARRRGNTNLFSETFFHLSWHSGPPVLAWGAKAQCQDRGAKAQSQERGKKKPLRPPRFFFPPSPETVLLPLCPCRAAGGKSLKAQFPDMGGKGSVSGEGGKKTFAAAEFFPPLS